MKKVLIDLIGKKFGRLTVLSRSENGRGNHAKWYCICDCGNKKDVLGLHLRRGKIVSCGCYKKENITKIKTKHGLHSTDEYIAWSNLIGRCSNKNSETYKNYGERGIIVCERWTTDFGKFYEDMGIKPSEMHSIDRIDVNGNYEPGNCKWSTPEEQARNKRVYSTNKVGVSGVSLKKGRWLARICVENKRIHLGYFDNLEEAVNARKDAEIKYWGKSS